MIPRKGLALVPTVPPGYRFSIPRRSELSDDGEGFGPFRDTWLIRNVTLAAAKEVGRAESTLVEVASLVASDTEEFDHIAHALESGTRDELPEHLSTPRMLALLEPHLDEVTPLEGLELGVAGLVYALAHVGCWTAASCRGHPDQTAWSPSPLVYLATDHHRALALEPLVTAARCGFNQQVDGDILLAIEAESLEDFMTLAQLVLAARRSFPVPRSRKRRPNQAVGGRLQAEQGRLELS